MSLGFITQTCHRKPYIKMSHGPFNSGIWKVTGALADTWCCVGYIHQEAIACGCDAWQTEWGGGLSLLVLCSGQPGCPAVGQWPRSWRPGACTYFVAPSSCGGVFRQQRLGELIGESGQLIHRFVTLGSRRRDMELARRLSRQSICHRSLRTCAWIPWLM